MKPLVEARGIRKDFPAVRALAGIDVDLHRGEVHALIGENGAGKSTLVKILSGEIADFEGSIALDGETRRFLSPREALAAGIAVIPQELQLIASLTVAENILLGREPRSPAGIIDRPALNRMAVAQLEAIGAGGIAAHAPLGSLDAASRQLVAIARALSLNARCIIMDEPTASLAAVEVQRFEAVVERVVAGGSAVLYISHKLDEVRRLAQRVTVLRDGMLVTTREASGLTEDEMVRLMVGREIRRGSLDPVKLDAAELLRVEHFSVRDPASPGGYRLRDVSFGVRAGEILGLAGLVGSGRTDLLLALVGVNARRGDGRIVVGGREYLPTSPVEARKAGLVMLPEDRKASGILPNLSVAGNLTISALDRVSRGGVVSRRRERAEAERLMRETRVRAAGPSVAMRTLSGGNQQKALLARCLYASPRILLLDEPTRGIDLAAKADVYNELRGLAAHGFAVVLCSSEMSEILAQCHRMLVFREGRVVAEFDREAATEEKVLAAAAGPISAAAVRGNGGPDVVAASPHGIPPGPPSAAAGRVSWRASIARYAGFFGLAAVLLLAIVTSPVRGGRLVFLDIGNLTDILRQVSEKGILAVGMTAVVISGGIDLSVGSLLAFGATVSGWLWMRDGLGVVATAAITVVLTAAWGLLNGIVVARWRLPAFIATLASMSAARGAARYLSGGAAIPLGFGEGGAPATVQRLAAPIVPYVPAPAAIFAVTALAMSFYLARTRGGRYIYAIGDNEPAARLAGVRVGLHTGAVYVLSAALAGLAGVVHCAQLQQGNPNDGVAYELDAIAAVVIGGTPLSGGTGTVGGTIIGILIIGVINNSMGLNNVDANLQLILKGVIILAAVWLQRR